MLQRGLITTGDLTRKMEEVAARGESGRSYHDILLRARVDAMTSLQKRRNTEDGGREKNIKSLGPAAYNQINLFRGGGVSQTMLQRGLITTDDLTRKMEEVAARGSNDSANDSGR